jgi:hypothetical protein
MLATIPKPISPNARPSAEVLEFIISESLVKALRPGVRSHADAVHGIGSSGDRQTVIVT